MSVSLETEMDFVPWHRNMQLRISVITVESVCCKGSDGPSSVRTNHSRFDDGQNGASNSNAHNQTRHERIQVTHDDATNETPGSGPVVDPAMRLTPWS